MAWPQKIVRAFRGYGAQETAFAGKGLRRLPSPVRLAQEVGTRLGAGEILFQPLPGGRPVRGMSKRPAAPHTPDGRYFVVIGSLGPRLWRATNPGLDAEERVRLTNELMSARRAVRSAADGDELARARARVNAAKIGLGERGPAWWQDGAPDLNRRLVKGTCYASWWASLDRA